MTRFVLMLFFAALAADIYIYRSLIVLRFRHLPARLAYIVFAIFTDGAALTAFLLYGMASGAGSAGVVTVMWLVWVFFLAAVPKLLYAAGGILDFAVRLVARRRVALFRGPALLLSAVTAVVMVCGATIGRTRLRVEEIEICSDRVPSGFDGYRMVQFSDLHIGTMLCPEKQTSRLVERMAGLGGDMVVNTGDLVNLTNGELTPEIMAVLSRLSAPDGVWSVWGNHDLGFYARGGNLSPAGNLSMLAAKVDEMGWRTLVNESAYVHRGGDSILLSGVGYPRDNMLNGNNDTMAGVDLNAAFGGEGEDSFNVVLAHTPVLWDEITARGRGDLTLSGHVHAMQTKFRFFGRVFSPAEWLYDEWSGEYIKEEKKNTEKEKKKRVLYINDGIGCVGYPMRVGARPEITVITLKRCE